MASSYTHSGTDLDRKALKRPDDFVSTVAGWFSKLAQSGRGLIITLGSIFLLSLGAMLLLNQRDEKTHKAADAFYLAQKEMENELKSVAQAEAPPVAKDEKAKGKDKAKETPPAPPVSAETVVFKAFDIDAKLPDTVKKLKAIDEQFGSVRPAFEARMTLGDLYYRHGEPAKSVVWYEKAINSAPGNLEKALSLSALGYAHENMGKTQEALKYYERAMNMGEATVKGDLLLAMARCYEVVKDSAKAKATYEQIIKDLPNTEYAKSAEMFKAQLH